MPPRMNRLSPVSPRAKSHAVEERVAATLRALREQQGLTLAVLARASGLSPAYLSRVENNSASLTLQNLAKVASALQVAPSVFFDEQAGPRPVVVTRRRGGKKQRFRGWPGIAMELPAADKRGKLMEPLIVEVLPRRAKPALRSHPGEEFNLVLEGSCRFYFGKELITLEPGDSAYYDASVPHAVQALPGRPCRLLAVVASRDYLFHGDISKLLQIP